MKNVLPMSAIENTYVRLNETRDESVSSLSKFVFALRDLYENKETVVLYSDVNEFWNNPDFTSKLV
jgi:hypothetical protein